MAVGYMVSRKHSVCTGYNDDAVLARFADHDRGYASGLTSVLTNGAMGYSFLAKCTPYPLSVGIASNSADDRDLGAHAGCGDRLISSFPTVVGGEQLADHCFTWAG